MIKQFILILMFFLGLSSLFAGIANTGNSEEIRNSSSNISNPITLNESNVCPAIYAPVCGVDGNTYSSSCVAGNSNVDILYAGECNSESINSSRCSGLNEMSCIDNIYCNPTYGKVNFFGGWINPMNWFGSGASNFKSCDLIESSKPILNSTPDILTVPNYNMNSTPTGDVINSSPQVHYNDSSYNYQNFTNLYLGVHFNCGDLSFRVEDNCNSLDYWEEVSYSVCNSFETYPTNLDFQSGCQ